MNGVTYAAELIGLGELSVPGVVRCLPGEVARVAPGAVSARLARVLQCSLPSRRTRMPCEWHRIGITNFAMPIVNHRLGASTVPESPGARRLASR